MYKFIFLFTFMFGCSAFAQENLLENYISIGLDNNLALKQKEYSLQKSIYELKEARGMFLPSLGIEARYSRADGGRIIEFPVGDLVNPIYDAINNTRINAGQNPIPFPTLENEEIPFLRKKEHDTRLRAVQPVIQPALFFNQKIKGELKEIKALDVLVYKRYLISEIKKSYLIYLKANEVWQLYQSTQKLLEENLRVNEKLVENGKATKEVVYRAQAELSKMEQNVEKAYRDTELAQEYFNHLLNRPAETTIEVAEPSSITPVNLTDTEMAGNAAVHNREELKQLDQYITIASNSKKLAGTGFLPNLNLVADYGFQGEKYDFGPDNDFWMVSGILSWNLFKGFQDVNKRQQAEIDKKKLKAAIEEAEQQIRLQAREAYYNVEGAAKSKESSAKGRKAAKESFKIISKKYEEGMASFIEYLDARNTLTAAETTHIINSYDLLINSAELERVTAAYDFKSQKY
jgi:outer membrane protein